MDDEFNKKFTDALADIKLDDAPFVATGVEAYELARATLFALAKVHGSTFVDDVAHAIADRRDAFLQSKIPFELETGRMLEDSDMWDDLDAAEEIAESG